MQTAFSLDPKRLDVLAEAKADGYRTARPFPHVVIDDFLPPDVLDAVLDEFPTPGDVEWWRFDSGTEKKLASTSPEVMGLVTRQVLAELNGATAIDFLRVLTGIEGLVPDPHLFGGGLHQIERGGFLEVHADFNLHPLTGLERRLNLLLYLNRDWDPAWGGALELWNHDMTRCEASIDPVFNRCVVFSTTARSYHGHPKVLACPDTVTRKSLALYYYARDADPSEARISHNTIFKRRPSRMRRLLEDLAPPAAVRGLHALKVAAKRERR
jgi:hypothetical protein